MSQNYAVPMPHDKNGEPLQTYPAAVKALAQYATEQVASSVVTLTDRTTVVEIAAVGGAGLMMRWVPSTETAGVAPFASVIASGLGVANWDHVIAPSTVRRFVVPIEKVPAQSVMGANGANGLYNRIAWISTISTATGRASVFGTEY